MKAFRLNKVSLEDLSCFSLFCFLCIPIADKVFAYVVGSQYAVIFTLSIVFLPYVIMCIERKKVLVPEFWLMLFAIVFFFLLTYMVHPEYKDVFSKKYYGVWPYVLRPDNGIYIFLLLRLLKDPQKILKTVKIAGWPMLLYEGLRVIEAQRVGYWVDTTNYGYEIHMSYNLSLGYDLLIFVLAYMLAYFQDHKLTDFAGMVIGLFIILVAGSRGPFLDVAIFVVLYFIVKAGTSKKKIILICVGGLAAIVFFAVLPYVLRFIQSVLSSYGIKSRFINKMISGDIADTSTRQPIWNAAIQMIRDNPLGYGAMGTRHVIEKLIYVGHPHNFFLEVLVDYGVVFGSVILVLLGVGFFRMMSVRNMDEWKLIFVLFFSRACQMLISGTYWHTIGLWSCLAIGLSIREEKRILKNRKDPPKCLTAEQATL